MKQARPDAATLLQQPAGPAVAAACSHLLEDIVTAAERLRAQDDAGLHDFRVALRRLRSLLRAFRPECAGVVRRRHRRRLAKLARASGRARDAEVQAELAAHYHGTAACDQVVRRLRTEARATRDRFVQRHLPRFDRLVPALRDGFVGMVAGVSFAAAMADRIRAAAARLAQLVAAIRDADDQPAIHVTRIAGKHLRYLIEPLGDASPHAAAVRVDLEQMQDALGDVHDHQVLRARLGEIADDARGKDLAKLGDRLRTEVAPLFARFRDRWAPVACARFLAAIDALALDLLLAKSDRGRGRNLLDAATRTP